MLTLCPEPLPSGQCCFQGTLSSLEIHGKAAASFVNPDALSHTNLQAIGFSLPITIQKGNESIKGITFLDKPGEIDALPFVPDSADLSYRVSYHKSTPDNKVRIQVHLDQPVDTREAMALAFSGPIPNHGECKSGDECRLIWPSTQEFGIELGYARDGLGQIVEGFPQGEQGAVQRVKLEIQSGTLRCMDEAGKPIENKAPRTLEWQAGTAPDQAQSLRVGGIYLDQNGLRAEVLATGLKPKSASIHPFLLAGAGGVGLLALGVVLWLLRRPQKTIRVFVSYAPEDKALLDEFENALTKAKHPVRFLPWHAGKLAQQEGREQEIEKQMEQADLILLMLSADHFASDALWKETQRAIQLHREKGKRLIQIVTQPCDVDAEPYKDMETLPKDKTAVALRESGKDRWKDIVDALLK